MTTNKKALSPQEKDELVAYYSTMITPRRWELFKEVIQHRTRYMTVVIEDVFQSHNASAVMRTCDCFGVQDVHVIENRYRYEVNPEIALGSSQWLTLHHYSEGKFNTENCVDALKSEGYRIVSTTPQPGTKPLHDFDVKAGKFALLFGTEKEGLSDDALSLADEHIRIPIYGFTESYNISVSAALCLFHLTAEVRSHISAWQLSEEERVDVILEWFRNTIRDASLIEKRFFMNKNR